MKEKLYSQLPPDVKDLIRSAREAAEKGGSKDTSSATRTAHQAETTTTQVAPTAPTTALGIMQAVMKSTSTAPDLRTVLAASRGAAGTRGDYCIADDGKIYYSMNLLRLYRSHHAGTSKIMTGSLMDSGANGGMAGNDVKVLAYHDHDRAQVTGIAGNHLDDLPIVTAAGFIESTEGPQ